MNHPIKSKGVSRSVRVKQTWTATLIAFAVCGCGSAPMPHAQVSNGTPSAKAPSKQQPVDANEWRLTPPASGPRAQLNYPEPVVQTLSNGLRVFTMQRAAGPVAISIVTRRSDPRESEDAAGLASLTAELLAEATRTKNNLELSEAAESLGSTLHGDAGRDYIRLSIDALPEDAEKGLSLLAESLITPAFHRKDFERLREQRLDELRAERQNPSRLASMIGLRMLLGKAYGNPVSGCPKTVRSLRVEDIKAWHQKWVSPEATALFLVGPINEKSALELAEKTLGKWRSVSPTTAPAAPEEPPDSQQQTVYVVDRPSSVQSAIFTLQRFPQRTSLGFIAREHLDNILGGLFTSRINHNLREVHGYTYGAKTATIATRQFGLFTVSTNVESNVTVPAIREILSEISAIAGSNPKTPVQTEELERSRADLVQSLGAHLEESHRVLADLEQLFIYELPNNYHSTYPSAVAAVTASDVARESDRLRTANTLIVVVGDAAKLQPELKQAGFSVDSPKYQCLED